jgi:RNA polymerase sigma-70 factor (ECF subfamily)
VLERLSPAQRTAFLLHDVFGVPFEEVARVVGRTPAAVRQLAARGRQEVARGRPRFPPSPGEQRALVGAFIDACRGGDLAGLVALLDPDVVCRGDGGGAVTALLDAKRGAGPVAGVLLTFARRWPPELTPATVNGGPGLVLRDAGGVLSVVALTVDGGLVTAIDVIRNPDKLTTLG